MAVGQAKWMVALVLLAGAAVAGERAGEHAVAAVDPFIGTGGEGQRHAAGRQGEDDRQVERVAHHGSLEEREGSRRRCVARQRLLPSKSPHPPKWRTRIR